METQTPAEPIIVDEAENQSFLGFKFGALINSEKVWIFSNCGRRSRPWTARRDSGEMEPPGRCRSCNQYNSAAGCLVLQQGVRNLLIGAGRENFRRGLTLDLRQPRLVFRVRMIRKWSILNRFYLQMGAHSSRPRRQLNAPGPSV
jgi:hypothetical protein